MPNSLYKINYTDELHHYGILGQKWGVRRYQNPDGSLTAAGKLKYRTDSDGNLVKLSRKESKSLTETKRQKEISRLNKESKKFEENQRKRFEQTEMGKYYKEFKERYPDAPDDDFSSYLSINNIKVDEPDFGWENNEAKEDLKKLSENYVRGEVATATLGSAVFLAPFSAIIAAGKTQNGFKAAAAAIGTIGGFAFSSLVSSNLQKKSVERKYGLRA